MAALIGHLTYGHHAGTVHRLAHKVIASKLATWEGRIDTTLTKDGQYYVSVNGKLISEGTVNPSKDLSAPQGVSQYEKKGV